MNILKCNILELQVLNQTKTWLRNPDDMQSVTSNPNLFICICIIFQQAFELVTGDSLFEPKAGPNFSLEEGKLFNSHH